MAKKDFSGAMEKLGRTAATVPDKKNSFNVVGDKTNLFRQQIEEETQKLQEEEIAIDLLEDNPYQILARPEMSEDALEGLVNSIKQNGFYGALLARVKNGHIQLAFGHRRREASKRAGLKTLPVKIVELNDTQMARLMASENFAREDLTPIGQANVIGYLYNDQNMTIDEIAETIGQKTGWVRLRLGLHNADSELKSMVEKKPDSLTFVEIISSVKDANYRKTLIEAVLNEKLTRDQLKKRVEKTNSPTSNKKTKTNLNTSSSQLLKENADQNEQLQEEVLGNIVTDFTELLPQQNSEKDNNVSANGNQKTLSFDSDNSFYAHAKNPRKGRNRVLEGYTKELEQITRELENVLEEDVNVSEEDLAPLMVIISKLNEVLAKRKPPKF